MSPPPPSSLGALVLVFAQTLKRPTACSSGVLACKPRFQPFWQPAKAYGRQSPRRYPVALTPRGSSALVGFEAIQGGDLPGLYSAGSHGCRHYVHFEMAWHLFSRFESLL